MKELETPKGISIQRQFILAWKEAGNDKNVFFKHNTVTVIIVQDHEVD
jgi:hypothetical protein